MFDPALIAKAQTETSDINLPTAAMNDLFGAGLRLGSRRFLSFAMSTLTLWPSLSCTLTLAFLVPRNISLAASHRRTVSEQRSFALREISNEHGSAG
jgi:hypothetical protein